MEKAGSRLRARKRSSSTATARRISCCFKCQKRFITFSGSDVCVDCRKNGVKNEVRVHVHVQEVPADLLVVVNNLDTVQNKCHAETENVENGRACEPLSTVESADTGIVIGTNDDGGTDDFGTQQNLQLEREATRKEQSGTEEEGTTTDPDSSNEPLLVLQGVLPVSKVALDANSDAGTNDVQVVGLGNASDHDNEHCNRSEDDDDGNEDGEPDMQFINESEGKQDHGDMCVLDEEQVVVDEPLSLPDDSTTDKLSLSSHDRSSQHASSSQFFATSGRGVGKSSYRCFICNADLSAVQGLKGRMNHIKRCGKKHGIQAGDGAKGLHVDKMGGQCANMTNVDRQGWHDDKDADLAIDDISHAEKVISTAPTIVQQNQSSLNAFFTRPVRSLDKILLQGARNVAKKERIASKRQQESVTTARSNGGGRGGGSWKRRKREPPTSWPAYKRISNTTVLVDAFHYANPALPQTHFLSHFHSDHYGGITKHWNAGIIYCSLPTASLVHSQLGVAKQYLHPLPMHTKTVIDANGRPISVTLLDANHCPGAAMLLFELQNGKQILHVGDFRWNREVMLDQPQLRQFWQGSNGMRLDDIYLDTTYCNEKYSTMPSQKEAITAAVSMAREEMEGPATSSLLPKCTARKNTSTLLLFGSYTIGKEKIFMACAQALNMRIYVEPRKLRILSALNFTKDQMDIFTTTKSEAQIWVVPMGHCSFQHLNAYLTDANTSSKGLRSGYSRVVAFRPTGWTHNGGPPKRRGASNANALITTRRSGNKTIHGVPYSEHSSFSELVDCLLCLKPKRIIPTVSVSSSEAQIERLLRAAYEEETREHD